MFSRTSSRLRLHALAPASSIAGFVLAAALAGCGERENNGLGVGLIADQAQTKAVQIAALSPPDTTADFQLAFRVEPRGSPRRC